MAIELRDYQIKALKEMKNGCILRGNVGSGKSRVAAVYFYTRVAGGRIPINGIGDTTEPTKPRDVYIFTTKRKKDTLDWEREFVDLRIGRDPEQSISHITLTVDTWNNIAKYADVKDAFIICDEQRLVGSGTWVKTFLKLAKNNEWILLSGTPGDVWLDYCPILIAHGFYRNRTDFGEQHIVWKPYSSYPQISHYVNTGKLETLVERITVRMEDDRHTVRHLHNIPVDFDKEKYDRLVKDRWNIEEERPILDASELFRLMRKLVNSDISRFAEVMKLLEKHPKLIIFYNFNYELEMLRSLAILGIEMAEWNGSVHQDIPKSDRWIYLVQYTAGSEAWNCTETDAICFWSLTYSYKIFEQAQGRIDRLNTPFTDLHYYILRSASPIDQAVWRALKLKKKFNERSYYGKFGGFGAGMERDSTLSGLQTAA